VRLRISAAHLLNAYTDRKAKRIPAAVLVNIRPTVAHHPHRWSSGGSGARECTNSQVPPSIPCNHANYENVLFRSFLRLFVRSRFNDDDRNREIRSTRLLFPLRPLFLLRARTLGNTGNYHSSRLQWRADGETVPKAKKSNLWPLQVLATVKYVCK